MTNSSSGGNADQHAGTCHRLAVNHLSDPSNRKTGLKLDMDSGIFPVNQELVATPCCTNRWGDLPD
jgi:hypothetical protein